MTFVSKPQPQDLVGLGCPVSQIGLSNAARSGVTNVIFTKDSLKAIIHQAFPDSKVHGANMGPIWGQQDPRGPYAGPMNFVIWALPQDRARFRRRKIKISNSSEIRE